METRTRTESVTFVRPFVIPGVDAHLPAGTYRIETDEERIMGISFAAFRRVQIRIQLPSDPRRPGIAETLIVDPNDFDAALARDPDPSIPLPGTTGR